VQLSNRPTGGQPSIAPDPFGDVFVVGPQKIPNGVNQTSGTGYRHGANLSEARHRKAPA
jgi:hypothetical protein